MNITDLQGKKIGILGFGIEGQAVAAFLTKFGLSFEVYDQNPDVRAKTNAKDFSEIFDREILFRSPGIKISEPTLLQAQEKGIVLTSQLKIFLQNTKAKIIGITGSKGKGTTAKLVYEILKNSGLKVFLGGNFGSEVLSLISEDDAYIVLELSSFQLADVDVSPHIAVVLMVVPEHLDYHKDSKEYYEAKSSITKYQNKEDFAVVNSDYEQSMIIGKLGGGKKYFVQTLKEESVGKADPFKIYKAEGFLKIKNGIFAEELEKHIYLVNDSEIQFFADAKEFSLPGFHNLQNVCAAIMVSKIVSKEEPAVTDQVILQTIREYKGLEHRLEDVGTFNGVQFFDDSFGTTPESALAAIKAFSKPEIVIIGGVDKGADYESFGYELTKLKQIKGVVLIGQISEILEQALLRNSFIGKIFTGAKNMSEVFDQVKEIALEGDIVLLAPGTSSFGMFKNYKDRGDQFKEAARKYGNS
ncbi:MAG: UDP-N-acetylmuramoyl-L-alanine--D-glutamate ligase [Candidatus Doudnabacteria bacterium]